MFTLNHDYIIINPIDGDYMYTLITKSGKIYIFSVKECAELYQKAYGGNIIEDNYGYRTTLGQSSN